MSLELYAAYIVATLVVLAVPGPTIMLVVSYALSHGRKSATASVLGVGLGDATAATVSLLGLGAILAASATAFGILKWAGAAYLLWLGVKMWRAPSSALETVNLPETLAKKIFLNAFVVTALNPKGIVFFMAFLPHFIAPGAPIAPQLVILGATFVVLGVLNAAVYALAASAIGTRLKSPAIVGLINRIGGSFLIGAALLTARLQRGNA
ncbi:threonine/homoserine/homoserine lactone efflux protein [Roseibium hamelinense]|uniref:Threonine/homoserine/homoserine lactone efflux protein n=1 Tax=Roseibium hamelinense TaxID=150831 RepID=A0A562T976_9HYPH|nr:LysE family translocator [Roseibium hamelinense]MTI45467.1 LysE family translocator [Roseibium hamelinense]TWI90159.1 threonine/homoserine/homoserine lactone efflux protein [Roseibium hamelinense]